MVTVPGRCKKALRPSNIAQQSTRQHKEKKTKKSSKQRERRLKTVSGNFEAFYDFNNIDVE